MGPAHYLRPWLLHFFLRHPFWSFTLPPSSHSPAQPTTSTLHLHLHLRLHLHLHLLHLAFVHQVGPPSFSSTNHWLVGPFCHCLPADAATRQALRTQLGPSLVRLCARTQRRYPSTRPVSPWPASTTTENSETVTAIGARQKDSLSSIHHLLRIKTCTIWSQKRAPASTPQDGGCNTRHPADS